MDNNLPSSSDESAAIVDHACRQILEYLSTNHHPAPELVVDAARLVAFTAKVDLDSLDNALERNGQPRKYATAFYAALRSVVGVEALLGVALLASSKTVEGLLPSREALEAGDKARAVAKTIKHRVKERLRDGWPIRDALYLESLPISDALLAENMDVLIEVSEVIEAYKRKPDAFKRSIPEWIRRAWLPLSLWNCVDCKEALERFNTASELFGFEQFTVDQFFHPWRTVRASFRPPGGKPKTEGAVLESPPGDLSA